MKLKGKNVLITGGAKRLGRAVVKALIDRGAHPVIHYNQSERSARELKASAEEAGVECELVQADLSSKKEAGELFDRISDGRQVRILINNASVFPPEHFGDTSLETWEETMNVNLTAPFQLCRQFVDRLGEGKEGRIINILDWRATDPQADHFSYTVSKGGLATMTRSLAIELAPDIQVNAVLPGALLPPEGKSEQELDHIVESTPADRWGTPEDFVEAVLFLATASSYITGEFLYVDGGRHLINR